ncbi:MAG: hemolysin family protein, partial [Oscillospiraceae bacterium]|nr:hemolysin family protein [Oscillospiraceae bacterium]
METDDSNLRSQSKTAKIFLTVIFAPIIGLNYLFEWILSKVFKNRGKVTEDDIHSILDAAGESGAIEGSEVEIINNVLEFDDLAVSDVMTHRVNVVGISAESTLDDIIYTALETGFSRLPVYNENLDDITGIIIVKDLLCLVGKSDLSDFSPDGFVRKVGFIPESCSCTNAFKKMKDDKASLAVVVDEYGGTAGIVTMEDLIEEVMGSIEDEYDEEEKQIEKIGEDKYKIDGETDPEEVLELFGYELPDDHEYETMAGFVTDLLGFIPEQNNSEGDENKTPYADYEDVRFVVREID